MSRVWLRMAGTSEATKYSLSPMPITTGGPERAATILFGSEPRNHGQREDAAQFLDGRAHGLFQVALEILLDQVGDDFGIGLGLEDVAFGFELMLERKVVLDDAVMHHHHVALAIAVRVRVLLGGPAVRGPARVADAERAIHRVHPDGLFQVAQLAFGAAHGQLAVVAINRQPGRIVSAILQPPQAFQNDRNGVLRADVAHNSAHRSIIRPRDGFRWSQSRNSTRNSSMTGLARTS